MGVVDKFFHSASSQDLKWNSPKCKNNSVDVKDAVLQINRDVTGNQKEMKAQHNALLCINDTLLDLRSNHPENT